MNKKTIKIFVICTICLILFIGSANLIFDSDYFDAKTLINAIEKNDIATVKRIIENNPGCINVLPYQGPSGLLAEMHVVVLHPLTKACMTGNYEMVALLIENGADVNVNSGMHTPLSITYTNKPDNWYKISAQGTVLCVK